MEKQKHDPLTNLLGFVNLGNKKGRWPKHPSHWHTLALAIYKKCIGKENVRGYIFYLLIGLIIVCRHEPLLLRG
jgi:hypothetical protein